MTSWTQADSMHILPHHLYIKLIITYCVYVSFGLFLKELRVESITEAITSSCGLLFTWPNLMFKGQITFLESSEFFRLPSFFCLISCLSFSGPPAISVVPASYTLRSRAHNPIVVPCPDPSSDAYISISLTQLSWLPRYSCVTRYAPSSKGASKMKSYGSLYFIKQCSSSPEKRRLRCRRHSPYLNSIKYVLILSSIYELYQI